MCSRSSCRKGHDQGTEHACWAPQLFLGAHPNCLPMGGLWDVPWLGPWSSAGCRRVSCINGRAAAAVSSEWHQMGPGSQSPHPSSPKYWLCPGSGFQGQSLEINLSPGFCNPPCRCHCCHTNPHHAMLPCCLQEPGMWQGSFEHFSSFMAFSCHCCYTLDWNRAWIISSSWWHTILNSLQSWHTSGMEQELLHCSPCLMLATKALFQKTPLIKQWLTMPINQCSHHEVWMVFWLFFCCCFGCLIFYLFVFLLCYCWGDRIALGSHSLEPCETPGSFSLFLGKQWRAGCRLPAVSCTDPLSQLSDQNITRSLLC